MNPNGIFGSAGGYYSVRNLDGPYGMTFLSIRSANNPDASSPPFIRDNTALALRLTVNKDFNPNGIPLWVIDTFCVGENAFTAPVPDYPIATRTPTPRLILKLPTKTPVTPATDTPTITLTVPPGSTTTSTATSSATPTATATATIPVAPTGTPSVHVPGATK